MRLITIAMLTAVMLVCAAPSHAQVLFTRKPKVNPSQRVPELIVIVKTNADERKRASAAEELREYDVAVFNEIVPVLIDVLQHEKKHGVRLEALTSLAKIRPVSAAAGHAIEKAAAEDDSVRVRLQARAVLPKYHLAGYLSKSGSSPTPTEKKTTTAASPPPLRKQTQEPPLAEPAPITVPAPPTTAPRPLPIPAPPVAAPRPLPTPPPATTPAPAPQVETPTDRPVPRPFPPAAVPAPQTPAPAQGPSLFP